MIIKKFTASTEKEAILLAKEELGGAAVVMNIKSITPKGFLKFFRKPTVEVTAAIDENTDNKRTEEEVQIEKPLSKPIEVDAIEKKLNDLQGFLEKQLSNEKIKEIRENAKKEEIKEKSFEVTSEFSDDLEEKHEAEKKEINQNLVACLQLIRKQLINNEVDEQYVNELVNDIEMSIKKDVQIDRILGAIYQRLVLKLGQPTQIEEVKGRTKYIFFLGPTGVGKTTTIAKIASSLKLKEDKKVALLTADTYRVAAVEQLRTYANILGIPLRVIYSAAEMEEVKNELSQYELVLVDTAGQSDKNMEQIRDIKRLIDTVSDDEKEVYLVLSATTKYRDLMRITKTYSEVAEYKLIFTKIDETDTIGNIYNILMQTKSSLSYVTFGQNVPDDIDIANTQSIAKQLLS